VLLAAPDIGINVLSNFERMTSGQAHYGAVIAPVVVIAAIYGCWSLVAPIRRVSRTAGTFALGIALALVTSASIWSYWTEVFLPMVDHLPRATERDLRVEEFKGLIPPDAAVSASSSVNPHVAHRERLYLFPDLRDAEYIFIDILGNPFPIDRATQRFRVKQLVEEQRSWGVVAAYDGFLVLRRGMPGFTIAPELVSFARVQAARGQRVDVDFGDRLRLISWEIAPGTTVHGRHAYARVTTYWQALRPLQQTLLPTLFVTDVDGTGLVHQDSYPAATTWYPTEQWPPGQVVKVEYDYVPLGSLDLAAVRVGVSTRNDRGEITGRLPLKLGPELDPLRRSADGTLFVLTTLTRR
jgi:hypothetical protein